MRLLVTVLSAGVLAGSSSAAVEAHPTRLKHCHHPDCAKHVADKPCAASSTQGYRAAFAIMHRDMNIRYTGDADTDFVRGMIPHHQGAIDMAEVVLKHGESQDIRELAKWIISVQKLEIGFMKHWLATRGKKEGVNWNAAASRAVAGYEQSNQVMHRDMNITYTGNADVDFAHGMIPHHQGAIDMARVLLKYGNNPELREMAEDVVSSQSQEIARMQRWLNQHGHAAAKPAAAAHHH